MATTPEIARLSDELEKVSYYGVGHAMPGLTEDMIPSLAGVARQLAHDPANRLRVIVAVAVRNAVLRLDPPKDMLAAAALLWLDLESDYDEDRARKRKTLSERHPEVAALLGYSRSNYERRKKWRPLYERIATELFVQLRQARFTAEPNSAHDAISPESLGYLPYYPELVQAGTDLHYTCLALLLIDKYETGPYVSQFPLMDADNPCIQRLFEEYVHFLAVSQSLKQDQRYLPRTLRIDDDLLSRLVTLRSAIRDCVPFDSSDEKALVEFGYRSAYELGSITAPRHEEIARLFKDVWLDWVSFGRIRFAKWSSSAGVVQLAANSWEFVAALKNYSEPIETVIDLSRRKAYRILVAHTGADDLRPFYDGNTLHQWAYACFTEMASNFTPIDAPHRPE